MLYVRVLFEGAPRYGLLRDDTITILDGDPFDGYRSGATSIALEDANLLAPCEPSKVIGIGLNYKEHAREMGKPLPAEPRFFFKPTTGIVGPGDGIVWPEMSARVDYEAELGVVIGKAARHVRPEQALGYVLGYTCGNDVTARDLQERDGLMNRAKAFDTFCPLGPAIATGLDPADVTIECRLNGELKQSGHSSDLIFSVPELIGFLSRIVTLLPGDVILTGALPNTGPMAVGDEVEVRIAGIGSLVNRLVSPGI